MLSDLIRNVLFLKEQELVLSLKKVYEKIRIGERICDFR